jgi:hypothetical protein
MVDANALMNAGLLVATGLAFSKLARYELLKRDKWTCQSDDCVGFYMNIGALQYKDGWMVNGAHYPDLHQKAEDKNIDNGRCLCVHCHIIEEIERGNHSGAGLLYEKQTIRHKNWLAENGWKDEKPPIFWYYDWVKADERGKLGLAQAYVEMFGLNETD